MKVGIVGAGIMGRLLAFALVNAGHQVDLFDQDDGSGKMSCSLAAAGLLTPVAETEKSDLLIFHLGAAALKQHWPAILKELDAQIYFQATGSLIVSHPRDKAELTRFIDVIQTKFQNHARRHAEIIHVCQKLNRERLLQLEPEIAKLDEAYYFPEEGHCDNQAILMHLARYLNDKGINWHTGKMVDEVRPGKVFIDDKSVEFDLIFDCRGMGAKSNLAHLHGVRGELIWLHAPDVTIHHPIRFLHPRYGLYVVPRPQNNYIVGASEIHAEDYTAISVKSTLELLSAAYYLHPGFAEARILQTVTQCRPTLPHYLPSIYYQDGMISINGLYRHGFLISPTLAMEVMRFLEHGKLSLHYPELWEQPYDQCAIQ